MNDNLAPVFLDNKPVSLNDPKPKLSAILSASGRPTTTDVKWLQFQPNTAGKSLRSEEVLDRTTDPSKPIYLTSTKGQQGGAQGSKPREGEAGFMSAKATGFGNDPKSSQQGGGKTSDLKPSAVQEDDDSGMQDDAEAGGEGDETGKKAHDAP